MLPGKHTLERVLARAERYEKTNELNKGLILKNRYFFGLFNNYHKACVSSFMFSAFKRFLLQKVHFWCPFRSTVFF